MKLLYMNKEKQRKIQCSASLDTDIVRWITDESLRDGRSFSIMVNRILRKAMDKQCKIKVKEV